MAEAKWYVVHTYSAYENTVKATIEKNVEAARALGIESYLVTSEEDLLKELEMLK